MVYIVTVKSTQSGVITRIVYTNKRLAHHVRSQADKLLQEQQTAATVTVAEAFEPPYRDGPETRRAQQLLSILNDSPQEEVET